MHIRLFIFLELLLLPYCSNRAMSQTSENEIYKVYCVPSLEVLKMNYLADIPYDEASDTLSSFFTHLAEYSSKWQDKRFPSSFGKGLFVERKMNGSRPLGCYMTSKFYTFFSDSINLPISYKYPKRFKSLAKAIIENTIKEDNQDYYFVRYNHLPMNMTCDFEVTCGLGILSKGQYFRLIFYAVRDSSVVVPIIYRVYCTKKGLRDVRRFIPMWHELPNAGVDDDGMIYVRRSNGESEFVGQHTNVEAEQRLACYLPAWSCMTDHERMRMLDDYILREHDMVWHYHQE